MSTSIYRKVIYLYVKFSSSHSRKVQISNVKASFWGSVAKVRFPFWWIQYLTFAIRWPAEWVNTHNKWQSDCSLWQIFRSILLCVLWNSIRSVFQLFWCREYLTGIGIRALIERSGQRMEGMDSIRTHVLHLFLCMWSGDPRLCRTKGRILCHARKIITYS